MKRYKMRAECTSDVLSFVGVLPAEEFKLIEFAKLDANLPDAEVTFKTLTFGLSQLKEVLRKLPDGHVMLETLTPEKEYTGDRTYEM